MLCTTMFLCTHITHCKHIVGYLQRVKLKAFRCDIKILSLVVYGEGHIEQILQTLLYKLRSWYDKLFKQFIWKTFIYMAQARSAFPPLNPTVYLARSTLFNSGWFLSVLSEMFMAFNWDMRLESTCYICIGYLVVNADLLTFILLLDLYWIFSGQCRFIDVYITSRFVLDI